MIMIQHHGCLHLPVSLHWAMPGWLAAQGSYSKLSKTSKVSLSTKVGRYFCWFGFHFNAFRIWCQLCTGFQLNWSLMGTYFQTAEPRLQTHRLRQKQPINFLYIVYNGIGMLYHPASASEKQTISRAMQAQPRATALRMPSRSSLQHSVDSALQGCGLYSFRSAHSFCDLITCYMWQEHEKWWETTLQGFLVFRPCMYVCRAGIYIYIYILCCKPTCSFFLGSLKDIRHI